MRKNRIAAISVAAVAAAGMAAGIAVPAVATAGTSAPAVRVHTGGEPSWLKWTWQRGSDRKCIIAWPAGGGTSALICKNGTVETS
jgi:hypothetical protein